MEFNKKAISPVVATALLLVVAVVAVVGFQSWFTTFQSKTFVDVEQKTDTGASVTIERLEGDQTNMTLYLKNGGSSALAAPTSINAGDCEFTPIELTAQNVTILASSGGTCTAADGTAVNVVVVTSAGVISGEAIVR